MARKLAVMLSLLFASPALADHIVPIIDPNLPDGPPGQLIQEFQFNQLFSERIVEAIVASQTFTAPDPFTAPLTSDPLAALIALGAPVPPNPLFALDFLTTLSLTTTMTGIFISPNAVFIGDADDLANLTVLSGTVLVRTTTTETTVDTFRLTATEGTEVSAVPEPGTLSLITVSIVGLVLSRRRSP